MGVVSAIKCKNCRKTMHLTRHAKYAKTVKLHNKFKAHDEKARQAWRYRDIVETRPLSKDKRFMVKPLKRADTHLVKPEEIV